MSSEVEADDVDAPLSSVARTDDLPFDQRLKKAKQGDASAFGALLEDCRPQLLAVARQKVDSWLRPRTSPSDLVQQTFIKALAGIEEFRGETEQHLVGWLQAILDNELRNCVRANTTVGRSIWREAEPLANEVDLPTSPEPTPSDALENIEEDAELMAALDSLPELQREVVRLRIWEAQSFDAIGQQTGRSADAARKLFGRAMEELANMLRGDT